MSQLQGDTWKNLHKKIPKDALPSLMHQLGRCFAVVHTVQGGWFGYIKENTRFQYKSWADAFQGMIADILADGKNHGKNLPYETIEAVVIKHRALLLEIEKPSLVDFDMWAGNVFINEQNDWHITGILDFERAFYGDPMADFVAAMMLFDDVEQEKQLQAGYSEVSGRPFVITPNDHVRMKLYSLYLCIIMIVETYRFNKLYAIGVEQYISGKMKKLLAELQ